MANREECIDACEEAYRSLVETLATNKPSPSAGENHHERVQLMLDTIAMTRTCADFQLRHSENATEVCKLCAKMCEACAKACEKAGGMDVCVTACSRCAEYCASMVAA